MAEKKFKPVQMVRGKSRVTVRDPFVLAELKSLGFEEARAKKAPAESRATPKKGAQSSKKLDGAPENK